MSRPIAVDLFAGAGGMSLGFEQAGFDVVSAVEVDPIHAAVHKFNFPSCAVIARSVQQVTGTAIREAANLGTRKVDLVVGGAPCQGFSLIGQRALDDPRNALVRDFVRIVRELEADYFVFENVKGITLGQHVQFLHELIQAFADSGYNVRLPWRVLNAADFGVPQHRERLILMGARSGLPLPTYPEPTTRPAGRASGSSHLPVGPSCKDALGDLPDAESFDALLASDTVPVKFGKPSAFARLMRGLSVRDDDFAWPREWPRGMLTASARTDHTNVSRRRFANTMPGSVEPISRFFKLPADGVSNTLRAGTDGARGAFTSPRPVHYEFPRCVTVREMARLHGFPDWFRFHVTKWHGARQIGNAVPPPLAHAVGRRIIEAAGAEVTRPEQTLALGKERLLTFDMSEAAAHFEVAALATKRDRKGAPKRRQWETEAEHAGPLAAE
jgi:DNA (cytosine-5)-methyltransferase 1